MSGVFYDDSESLIVTTGENNTEVEVGGVYCSKDRWNKQNISHIDRDAIVDEPYWDYQKGNVVAFQLKGEIQPHPYRIDELSHESDEPKRIVISNPTENYSYILNRSNGRFFIEKKYPDDSTEPASINPNDFNTVQPLKDSWVMEAFGEEGMLMAQKI